ncbi:hypothetical protein KPL70_025929 [Citrus sinensis]|nr:hypothetical protein KPL70_025929 [Citrus sinensis]
MINNHIWGPEFNKKEAEIKKLKAELSRIDAEKTRPSLFTQPQPTPVSPPIFETYAPFYTPSRPQQPVYNQFFGFSHLQPTPQPSSPKKSRSKVKISEPRPKVTSSSSTSTIPPEESPQDHPEPLQKDKGSMDQYHYHTVQIQSSDSFDSSEPETNNSSSSSSYDSSKASTDFESEYADITGILMATEAADPSASTSTPIVDDNPSDQASQTDPVPPPVHEHSTKPSSASWFTFDDIPRHKWAARLQEFAALIDLQAKVVRLIQHLQHSSLLSENEDVESNFSEQSAQDDQTVFLIAESSNSEDISVIFTVQNVNHVSTIPRPSLKMSILPSKFHKPISVIGFIDTGVDTSMIDPSVLPSDCWERHSKLFRAVNGETFETTLITKKPIDTLRLYALSETSSPYSQISQKFLEFCPENHSQFHHPSPLWKNEQFFIHLPFKLNEDINPTKASHSGMSPSDLLLTKQECSQLLQKGLIESTDSDWACQAFYVEKRSELVRGKKRLVIDYQPLNSFLKDDKFPLLKIQTLFVHFQGARIFSKFDLKAGFWQLGISPVDRHKTAFCIPDAHYQWTVMPFGLKVTPSLFQKAMTKIFSPILHHALVYIDDILLFSSDHESHQKLLLDFFHIVQAHGIMLSEKKSSLGNESIDFLGMVIKDGQPKKPDRFPNLCMEHLFLTGLTLSSLSISEDELWYMWCLTTLYATKLVFPIKLVLTHLTTPEFSPDLLWTLFEWPYFQHPETRDYWTQDMAYEWRTYPHPYTFIHDTSVTSVLKVYLMELNNVPPPTINIHHTSIGPSHTLEIIPKTQGCTSGSSSSPQGILVMEQRPNYTNVLFQDAQDPWEDFQSLLHTDTPHYTVTNPDSPAASTSQHMSEVNEEKYQQAKAYLN